ncbi:EpsG family protein [uncultured Draconibacterium sp.]|uniref:EpsG family protein n=1 Tax=uncultured Draconibacterium sp. TaxID=1573823 RepID=UPI0032168AA8
MNKALKVNLAILTSVFIIYPLAALPLMFLFIRRNIKYSYYLLALFMGFLGYILIPETTNDLTRYYETFQEVNQLNLPGLLNYLTTQLHYTFFIFSFIIGKLGLNKQFLPFFAVYISYLINFLLFYNFSKNNNYTKAIYVILFVTIFFTTPFKSIALSIRNFVALSFICWGVFKLFTEEKNIGWLYIGLALITHFMTLLLLPVIVAAKIFKEDNKWMRIAFLISFLFYFIPTGTLVENLLSIDLSAFELIEKKQVGYTTGYWATDYIDNMSSTGRIFKFIDALATYIILFYLVITKEKSKYRNLLYLAAILMNVFFSLPMIYRRYGFALRFLFILLLLYEYRDYYWQKSKRNLLIIIMMVSILVSSARLYSMRQSALKSYPKMIYQSALTIFSNKINESDYIVK